MNIRELTCIGCPMGCQLRATLEDGVVTAVTGNTCPRGDAYARKECVHPERTVTTHFWLPAHLVPLVEVVMGDKTDEAVAVAVALRVAAGSHVTGAGEAAVRALGKLDEERLNVDGGAVALGHPVGASGARIVLHTLHVLRERQAKRGIASICIGGGLGGAILVETVG